MRFDKYKRLLRNKCMVMAFDRDIRVFQAVKGMPLVVSQWFREHQSLKEASTSVDLIQTATHLARATTSDPSFNMYTDESRRISTRNPLNEAFEKLHGKIDPLKHYQSVLQRETGHKIVFDSGEHAFKKVFN